MAADVQKTLGEPMALEVGSSGEFTVWLDGKKIVEKTTQRFPESAEVIEAIRVARMA